MVSFAIFAGAAPLAGVLAGAATTGVSLIALGAVGAAGCVLYRPAARAS